MSCPSGSCGVGSNRAGNFGGGSNKVPKGYSQFTTQKYTPDQMNLFQSLFKHLGPDSATSKLASGDQSQFEALEAPALRQFSQFQSDTANRFSGMGTGARRSSGHANYQNQGASEFAEKLQSQRLGLQQNALRDLMGMSTSLLAQQPYEQFLLEKQQKPNRWGSIVGGALPIVGAAAGGYFGGPAGAKIGASVGAAAGKAFL